MARIIVVYRIFLWLIPVTLGGCFTTSQQDSRRTVILISIDGMRADYIERYNPPTLKALAQKGAVARGLTPVFPSKTFPSHYSIATGLTAERHGIVGNRFYDPQFDQIYTLGNRQAVEDGKWYGGEPIWVTAEKQGVRTACYFWPGSEARIKGVRPHRYKKYDGSVPNEKRVDQVVSWLGDPTPSRPRFVTLYFSDVDTAGHKYGPISPQVAEAVANVDGAIRRLVHGIDRIGMTKAIDLVIVSDHGMAAIDPQKVIPLAPLLQNFETNKVVVTSTLGMIWSKDHLGAIKRHLKAHQRGFKVFERHEIPDRLRFKDHRRIAPLVLIMDEGWTLVKEPPSSAKNKPMSKGTHGYDNQLESMQGMFIAYGEGVAKSVDVGRIYNIEVYQFIAALLDIEPAPHEGRGALLKVLR